jgi:transporter family-2 protein
MTSSLQILIPIVVGISVAVQAQFMAEVDRSAGTIVAMFVTYGGGGLLITLVMLALGGGNISALATVPPTVLFAGVLGLIIVGGISFSAPRIGLVGTFTTIVTVQFIASALIDHYGFFGATVRAMSVSRVAGIAMLLGGVWMIVR